MGTNVPKAAAYLDQLHTLQSVPRPYDTSFHQVYSLSFAPGTQHTLTMSLPKVRARIAPNYLNINPPMASQRIIKVRLRRPRMAQDHSMTYPFISM